VQADTVIKLERLAMQEVAEGVVLYSLPPPRTVPVGEGAA
jgi:hypothetical protein